MTELSRRAQKLRDQIAQNGGWMSRLDIAKATGKKRQMPHDTNLLEQLSEAGILEKRQRSLEGSGITDVIYEYRLAKIRKLIKREPVMLHIFYRQLPGHEKAHIRIVDAKTFKMVSGGKITNRNDLYSHLILDNPGKHNPNLQIQAIIGEKKLSENRKRQIRLQVMAYLIVHRERID